MIKRPRSTAAADCVSMCHGRNARRSLKQFQTAPKCALMSGEIVQYRSHKFMEKHWVFTFSRWLVGLICRIYFRIEYVGADLAPKEGAMIVAPNHVSYCDPFWVSVPFDRPLRY